VGGRSALDRNSQNFDLADRAQSTEHTVGTVKGALTLSWIFRHDKVGFGLRTTFDIPWQVQ
jgi:hypothetical protein